LFPNPFNNQKMSSRAGKTCRVELGPMRFKWTIEDFKGAAASFPVIKSPSFVIPSTNPTIKARPFHLEMKIPKSKCCGRFRCPVYLHQKVDRQIETKITLDDFSPKPKGTFFGYAYGSAPFVHVSLGAKTIFQEGWCDEKKVMTVTLPGNKSSFPADVTIEFEMTQNFLKTKRSKL
jgi:hypothetical protein